MHKKIQRIMCVFGKHKISPTTYKLFGVRLNKCEVCGKILNIQNVNYGTIL